jgi:hypothetical protein
MSVCGVIWFHTDWIARVWSITGTVWFIHHPWPHVMSINFSYAHYLGYFSMYCYATQRVCLLKMYPHSSCHNKVQIPWSEGLICDWYSAWNTLYYWFVIFVLSDVIFRWIMPLLCGMFYWWICNPSWVQSFIFTASSLLEESFMCNLMHFHILFVISICLVLTSYWLSDETVFVMFWSLILLA